MPTRKSGYTYNPKTGKWSKNSDSKSTQSTKKKSSKGGNSGKSNLTSSSSNKKSSKGKTDKKYNTIEMNTLSGTLSFIADEKTIKLKAGDTVKLQGLGIHLSGNYYVKDITRQISSSGYVHTATVIKTDFGGSLVKTTKTTKKKTKKSSSKKVSSSKTKTKGKTYTVKKGDTPYSVAKKVYGDSSKVSKLKNSSGKSISSKTKLKIGQVLKIT